MTAADTHRTCVVAVIQNGRDEYLICRKPADRGVFPGQWALPGGGIEPGERMTDALIREVREEVGLEITAIHPHHFKDGAYPKLFPGRASLEIYMIFLIFTCRAAAGQAVTLGDEFEAHAWVPAADLARYDLNVETQNTFMQLGVYP